MMQIAEDPTIAGRYIAVDAPEFATHASGQLFVIDAQVGANPDGIAPQYLTSRSTFFTAPAPDHSGRYRNPVILANGVIIASHTVETGEDEEQGSLTAPDPRYDFRIKFIIDSGTPGVYRAGANLTAGITRTASYYTPDVLVTYSGPLWELSPVEVRAVPAPPSTRWVLKPPEQQLFDTAGINLDTFRDYLRERDLGVIVMRNVTRPMPRRAAALNLRVPEALPRARPAHSGARYRRDAVRAADQIAGSPTAPTRRRGTSARALFARQRRTGANPTQPGVAAGSRRIASDGSVALFVRRAVRSRGRRWRRTTRRSCASLLADAAPGEIRTWTAATA